MSRQLGFIVTNDYNSYTDALDDSIEKNIIYIPEVSLVAEYIVNEMTHLINNLRKDINCEVTRKIDILIKIEGFSELRDIVSPNFLLVKSDLEGKKTISTAINYIKKECNLDSLIIQYLGVLYDGKNSVHDPSFYVDLKYTEYRKEEYTIGQTDRKAICNYFYLHK